LVTRGDIWVVNLDPTQGSEIRKSRPCVVVSPPEMLDHLRTVLVAPMTSKGQPAPFRIPITHDGQKGLVLLDQIRAVDKTRLVRKSGRTSSSTLANILATLQTIFGP
jgi:mRNA interferase MazF